MTVSYDFSTDVAIITGAAPAASGGPWSARSSRPDAG